MSRIMIFHNGNHVNTVSSFEDAEFETGIKAYKIRELLSDGTEQGSWSFDYEIAEKKAKVLVYRQGKLALSCPSVNKAIEQTGLCRTTLLKYAGNGREINGMTIKID
jgi:hypothetical protein